MLKIMEILTKKEINYPETDGKPMAESTLQFQWLTLIKFGLEATFREDENVFVCRRPVLVPGRRLSWYLLCPGCDGSAGATQRTPGFLHAVERRQHPAAGRHRNYFQRQPLWRNDEKIQVYERYGVQEYYIYDPERNELEGWLRENDELQPVSDVDHFLSPLLRIRFERTEDILNLYHPDGKPFVSYLEIFDKNEQYVAQLAAQQELLQAESERANAEKTRADKLALRLQELGIDPDTI